MATDFPNSPSVGDLHQIVVRAWQWDGEKWKATGTTSSSPIGVSLVFEGATADAHETTLTVVDPTADRTITLPNATGTVLLSDAVNPASADGGSLGTTSLEWSDLYLADGGVIYFGNDQDVFAFHVHNL